MKEDSPKASSICAMTVNIPPGALRPGAAARGARRGWSRAAAAAASAARPGLAPAVRSGARGGERGMLGRPRSSVCLHAELDVGASADGARERLSCASCQLSKCLGSLANQNPRSIYTVGCMFAGAGARGARSRVGSADLLRIPRPPSRCQGVGNTDAKAQQQRTASPAPPLAESRWSSPLSSTRNARRSVKAPKMRFKVFWCGCKVLRAKGRSSESKKRGTRSLMGDYAFRGLQTRKKKRDDPADRSSRTAAPARSPLQLRPRAAAARRVPAAAAAGFTRMPRVPS